MKMDIFGDSNGKLGDGLIYIYGLQNHLRFLLYKKYAMKNQLILERLDHLEKLRICPFLEILKQNLQET